jgi:hypothetical protein
MASEDSDQLRPGLLAIHRLRYLRDGHETCGAQVPSSGNLLHAVRELLEVALLCRPQRIPAEERNHRSQQVVTAANDVLRQVLFVVVVPAVLEEPPDTKEVPQIFEARAALNTLRDHEPVGHLVASLVAAPAPTASLADEPDREASFPVYKANHPASPDQPFLLVFRTVWIVTAHNRSLGRVPDRYSGFPAYSRMLTALLPARRATIYLRTVIVTAAVYRGLVSVLRGRSR